MNFKLYFFINLFFTIQLFSQIGETIPLERRVDWSSVGYHRNPANNLPTPDNILYVESPSINPEINYRNIISKIEEARNIEGLTAIVLKEGVYKITKPIKLGIKNSNLILKGMGKEKTTINCDAGYKLKRNDIIIIKGNRKTFAESYQITYYNKEQQTITLTRKLEGLSEEDYIDIRVPNGSWHNSINHGRWSPPDYFGQIVEVDSVDINGKHIKLKDDISYVWENAHKESLIPYLVLLEPIREIGIEDIKLISDTNNNNVGINIRFELAVNCWVRNVESVNPPMSHININSCSSIEIRNCFFLDAQDHGYVPGAGYGVSVFNRSTNCLIEDNVFKHLRHSMMVSLGASRNVFGYNYSLDQYSSPTKNLADLNVHGHYPFANLFEGNYVDRITADNYWGKNGDYNTFIRNFCKYKYIVLQETSRANLIGNICQMIVDKSEELLISEATDVIYTEDISYYRSERPEFYKETLPWPSIGPPTFSSGVTLPQTIPAKRRYCSWPGSDCDD